MTIYSLSDALGCLYFVCSDVASTSNAGDDGDDSDSDQPMSKANK